MGDVGSLAHAWCLREPEPGEVFRLVGPIRLGGAAAVGARTGSRGICKAYDRDKAVAAAVRRPGAPSRARAARPGEQWEAVYRAALGISLGDGLRLWVSDVLHTDPGQLGLLLSCIRSRQYWPRMTHPHGALMFAAARIEGEMIVAASGAQLMVEGSSGKRCAFPRDCRVRPQAGQQTDRSSGERSAFPQVHRGRADRVAGRTRAAGADEGLRPAVLVG